MKSFIGVLHLDGSAPDGALLERLARHIRLESSSEPEIAIDSRCALAAVSHRGDTRELIVRDGAAIIAGELRLDEPAPPSRVEELRGDFAFARWDGQTLVCARDRFGVWPFYYARIPRGLVFSDSLEAILAHPDVPIDLDEGAAAGYLAGGMADDPAATIHAAVRRLPPAHTLTVRRGGEPSIRAYWTLEPRPRTASRGAPERLHDALQRAIASRVTGSSAVVFMSGGLDSTTLAALTRETRPRTDLLAITSVYRSRIRDVEEPFAAEAARSIGIASRIFPLDAYSPLDSLRNGLWTPEPGPLLSASMTRDVHALAAAHAPVALHGHPADALFVADPDPQLRALMSQGRFARLFAALVRYTLIKRRPPWFLLRGRAERPDRGVHALRSSMGASYFEWAHPLQTRAPVRLVYPWLDARVLDAALELEPVPWLIDKHIVRTILRGRVSETVRRRRKTYLAEDPWRVPAAEAGEIRFEAAARYVDPERFAEAVRRDGGMLADATLRAAAFEYWLRELPRRVAALRVGL
jgi:asparagine synthase (glutamine-hydrolysing)